MKKKKIEFSDIILLLFTLTVCAFTYKTTLRNIKITYSEITTAIQLFI